MAVYTHLGAEDLSRLISHYDVGTLVSAKGIAEGVSNSNWLIETTGGKGNDSRFILTMYERRIELDDLPFFLGLLDYLAGEGCPVPRTIHDRDGAGWRMERGKAVALIEFLPGVSVDSPTPEQAYAVGQALAGIHTASQGFSGRRANDLRPADWRKLISQCDGDRLAEIDPALPAIISEKLPEIEASWPENLPHSIIHADLFPDNVLLRDDTVTGLIDFYFACNDITAYDLAVTHAAWCFADHGRHFLDDVSAALIAGYQAIRPLTPAEQDCFPILAQGAAMRFIATRAFDWLHTPDDALVTRKNPMDFARRLQFYAKMGNNAFSVKV